MQSQTEQNKKMVVRFNKEFVEQGIETSFTELISPDVVNHSAPAGSSAGRDGMYHFLQNILRVAFPDLKVQILDQAAEGDLVFSRKEFHATHSGVFMGIPPTGQKVVINVIDLIRLKNGQYVEHWGMSNIPEIIARLSAK
jgi:predicted ester cyclase